MVHGIGWMEARSKRRGNGILTRQRCRKTRPLFVLQEQKESCLRAIDAGSVLAEMQITLFS
jgi:hypothetical protein